MHHAPIHPFRDGAPLPPTLKPHWGKKKNVFILGTPVSFFFFHEFPRICAHVETLRRTHVVSYAKSNTRPNTTSLQNPREYIKKKLSSQKKTFTWGEKKLFFGKKNCEPALMKRVITTPTSTFGPSLLPCLTYFVGSKGGAYSSGTFVRIEHSPVVSSTARNHHQHLDALYGYQLGGRGFLVPPREEFLYDSG